MYPSFHCNENQHKDWMNQLQQNVPKGGIVIGMCATKCDLEDDPDTSQAEALAAETGAIFMKTSSKTNSNVQLLFQKVTERVLEYQQKNSGMSSAEIPVTLGTTAVDTASPPVSPTKAYKNIMANKNSPPIGNNQQFSLTPRTGVDASKPFADEKKMEMEESNDEIDSTIEMPDDSSIKQARVARCDSTKLMCGNVVGVSEDGSMVGCVLQ